MKDHNHGLKFLSHAKLGVQSQNLGSCSYLKLLLVTLNVTVLKQSAKRAKIQAK